MSNGTWRVMDMAWLRNSNTIYDGEAVVLACLLKVKKRRNHNDEETMKDILVFKEKK